MITDKNKDFLAHYGSAKHIDALLDDTDNENKHFVTENHLFNENHARKFLSLPDTYDYDERNIFKTKAVPKDIIDKYSSSSDRIKVNTVSRNPNLTKDNIDFILSSENRNSAIPQLLINKEVMKHHKDFILNHNVSGKMATKEHIRNANLDENEYSKYVNHPDPEIRSEVAKIWKLPIQHQETLSNDPNLAVRTHLVINNNTHQDILRNMMKDPNEDEAIRTLAKANAARRGNHYL